LFAGVDSISGSIRGSSSGGIESGSIGNSCSVKGSSNSVVVVVVVVVVAAAVIKFIHTSGYGGL
jgi:hypothetical protein